MTVYTIDPIHDPRWSELLTWHPDASVFHTPAWLSSLRETYGYTSFALTTTEPAKPLQGGLVLTTVKSWLTGSRLISVPFADHCQPLVNEGAELAELIQHLHVSNTACRGKVVEVRPTRTLDTAPDRMWASSRSFYRHVLSLQTPPCDLFRKFDKTSVRQPIRRAEREGVEIQWNASPQALHTFFQLLVATRRRHGVPPQPFAWFEALVKNFGSALLLGVARCRQVPIAAILCLRFGSTLTYKYSCSDPRWKMLGGTPCLLWDAIQNVQAEGATALDLGRTEIGNEGLTRFKDHWGAMRTELTYYRNLPTATNLTTHFHSRAMAQKIVAALPDCFLVAAGRILYRHMG